MKITKKLLAISMTLVMALSCLTFMPAAAYAEDLPPEDGIDPPAIAEPEEWPEPGESDEPAPQDKVGALSEDGGGIGAFATVGPFTITYTGGGEPLAGNVLNHQDYYSDMHMVSGVHTLYINNSSGRPLTIEGNGSPAQGHIVVLSGGTGAAKKTITLRNINLDMSATAGACAFSITTGATVDLILSGTNTLRSGLNRAGLEAPEGSILTIQWIGTLDAFGGGGGAGIGGAGTGSASQRNGGTITIESGTVNAGGGYFYNAGTDTAYGGGAGIGGGVGGDGGTVKIIGGTVNASGSAAPGEEEDVWVGAGIGGGSGGSGGNVTITGGIVAAECGRYDSSYFPGYGIGPGYGNEDGTINISGGKVTAVGGSGALKGASVLLPASSYTWWASEEPSDPEGAGTNSQVLPFDNDLLIYFYVRIEAYDMKTHELLIHLGDPDPERDGPGWRYEPSSITNVTGVYRIFGNTGDYNLTITGSTKGNRVIVEGSSTKNITLDGAFIDASGGSNPASTCPFYIDGTAVNLTLVGHSSFTAGYNHAAIEASSGSTLTIQGSGRLNAKGGEHSAGIGGGYNGAGGTITINGGDVTAEGGDTGAGIGGGYGGEGGTITITNGKIEAIGGVYAAGIGGGMIGSGGTISITNGEVTTTGGNGAAGIGGGSDRMGGIITIGGGTIKATSGNGAAGIGGSGSGGGGSITINAGDVTANSPGTGAGIGGGGGSGAGGSITINGGSVKANSGAGGAGIGGGNNGNGGIIAINGGTVTATGLSMGVGYNGGAGIGSGHYSTGGEITISAGTIIAQGGSSAAGIGNGQYGSSVNITIEDGTVTATGGGSGAGIGGGQNGSAGTITIKDGSITATGGYGGAGIGGGGYCTSGTIEISGGEIEAISGQDGAGIGGGEGNPGGMITIKGGIIIANSEAGNGAGIGGGVSGEGGQITITKGTITATSLNGAGIGGGQARGGGMITISGGEVTATCSDYGGAGIGGGYSGSGGTITIDDGLVKATGGDAGAGIGGGYNGDGGTVKINGGTVDATGGVNGAGIGSSSGYSGTINIGGGLVTAIGARALSGSGEVVTAPMYRWWFNYTTDNPGGAGRSSSSEAFTNKNEYKFVRIMTTPGAEITPAGTQTFTGLAYGYTQPAAREFNIKNIDSKNITGLLASLEGGPVSGFEISTGLSGPSINAGGTVTVSVRPKAGLSAGTWTDTLVITGSDDFYITADLSFTVGKATLTPSINFAGVAGKVYDGTTSFTGTPPAISLSGAVNSESPAATANITFVNANAGTNKAVNATGITLSGTWGNNYTLSAPSLSNVPSSLEITRAPLSINTVAAPTKTYDGGSNATAGAVTFSGLLTGETLTRDYDYSVTAEFTGNLNAGTGKSYMYTITMFGTTTTNNYTLATNTKSETNGTINKAGGLSATAPPVIFIEAENTSQETFNLDNIVLNRSDWGTRNYTLGTLNNASGIIGSMSLTESTLTYTGTGKASGTATRQVIIETQNYTNITVTLSFEAWGEICAIGATRYSSLDDAIAAASSTGVTEIRLLESITQTTPLVVNGKEINFNLGNFNLNLNVPGGTALSVINGGKVGRSGTGTFNITNAKRGIYVEGLGTEEATVDNIHVTGQDCIGVNTYGGKVTVTGNVTAENIPTYRYGTGISAWEGAEVSVVGSVFVSGIDCYGVGVNAGEDSHVSIGEDLVGTGLRYVWFACIEQGKLDVAGDVKATGRNFTGIYTWEGEIDIAGSVTIEGSEISGVHSEGKLNVAGDVSVTGDWSCGAGAYNGELFIGGDIICDGDYSKGIETYSGSKITVAGHIIVVGDDSTGVCVESGGNVTVDGRITGPSNYIVFEYNDVRTVHNYIKTTTKQGYRTYTDGWSTVWVKAVPEAGVSVTPSLAILAEDGDEAVFKASLGSHEMSKDNIRWDVQPEALIEELINTNIIEVSDGFGTDTLTIEALNLTGVLHSVLRVHAVYIVDGKEIYTATSALEIMPGGLNPSTHAEATTVRLLENKATINTAKERGALVPVLISNRPAVKSFGAGAMDAGPVMSTGADLGGSIEIGTYKNKVWTPAAGYSANWYENDARYIEISAAKGTKKLSNALIRINLTGGEYIDVDGKITLTVTEKYPKITLKVDGNLNKAFPDASVKLTATSPDGECTIEDVLKPVDGIGVVFSGNTAELTMTNMSKLGNNKTYKPVLRVKVAGYTRSYATYKAGNDKGLAFSVKVVNAMPKLKLSKKSVTLGTGRWLNNSGNSLYILSNDKNVKTPEIVAMIKEIRVVGNDKKGWKELGWDPDERYGEFWVWPTANTVSGGGYIEVSFKGSDAKVKLPFSVKLIQESGIKISSKTKAATVHMEHASGYSIISFPYTTNAHNVNPSLSILSTGSGKTLQTFNASHPLNGALTNHTFWRDGVLYLSLNVGGSNNGKLKAWFEEGNPSRKDKKIDLNLGASSIPGKTIKLTLTVTAKAATGTVKVTGSGKINVAQPGAFTTATLSLKNTHAAIASITPLPADSDFVIGEKIGTNKFKIYLKPDRLSNVKMAKQTIYPEIVLESGHKVSPKITLTPTFTASKSYQSTKAGHLYHHTPHHGAEVKLNVTTPANANLGVAEIDPASYAKLGFETGQGLELVRAGENTWTIVFENYSLPQMKANSKGKPVALKSSYNLKINLWAEGTYLTEADKVTPKRDAFDRIIPLHNGAGAKQKNITKPKTITVKVNVVKK